MKEISCWSCGESIFKKDIAQERTIWPVGRKEYLCTACKKKQVQAMIDKNREELGHPRLGQE